MPELEKTFITFDRAVGMLPDGEYIHTFRTGGPCLIGADHEREMLLRQLKINRIELTGEVAQSMNHGIAIKDDHGWLFIETKQAEK